MEKVFIKGDLYITGDSADIVYGGKKEFHVAGDIFLKAAEPINYKGNMVIAKQDLDGEYSRILERSILANKHFA